MGDGPVLLVDSSRFSSAISLPLLCLPFLIHAFVLQAMLAAQESIAIDPAVSKSWCRLGDAYRDTGRWQLAHLAYTCALELAPYDTDIKVRPTAELQMYFTNL
jgi:hypothetical protein